MRGLHSRRHPFCGVVLVMTLAVGCSGSGDADEAGRAADSPPAVPLFEADSPEAIRAAPRWENLASFSGTATLETPPFSVTAGAIQWRVKWTCETGTVRAAALPSSDSTDPLVDSACPATGEGFSIETGELRLAVEASGPWQATVEQQVDTPIDEPPLPEMASAPVLAEGSFYAIDEPGSGTVRLYQLADGQRALRFEDFEVFLNTDLVVWLSEAPRPTTSAESVEAPYVEIAPLKSTLGPQNYLIPPEVPSEAIRSVVLWCPPIGSAYLGATLVP